MTEKYSRGGVGSILVRMEHIHEAGTGILGLDGKELVVGDTRLEKERRARTNATVIQVPISLGRKPIGSTKTGLPAYGPSRLPEADVSVHDAIYARPQNKITWMSDIAPEVKVGDKIFFPWTQTLDSRNVIAKARDGKSVIVRISYDTVYAVIRERKIIPIGGHILIDPVFETWDHILKPTFYNFNGPDGKPAPRPKSEWIAVKTAPKHIDREGVVKHIGTPLKGQRCALKPGTRVLYKPKLQNMVDIEGEKYFIMRQDQILLYR